MKLYKVPPKTKIRVVADIICPPGAPEIKEGEILFFDHLDGMYSYCTNSAGNVVHLSNCAEVETV